MWIMHSKSAVCSMPLMNVGAGIATRIYIPTSSDEEHDNYDTFALEGDNINPPLPAPPLLPPALMELSAPCDKQDQFV